MRRGTTLTPSRLLPVAAAVAVAVAWAPEAGAATWQRVEAERLHPIAGSGLAVPDHLASGRHTLALRRGRATALVTLRARASYLTLRVRRGSCLRAGVRMWANGHALLATTLRSPAWVHITVRRSLPAGRRRITLGVVAPGTCAIRADTIAFRSRAASARPAPTRAPAAAGGGGASPALLSAGPAPGDPFAGQRFYIEPDSPPAKTEAAWRAAGRTADAEQMHKVAATPQAWWAGGWRGDIRAAVAQRLAAAHAQGASTDVLVTWNADLLGQCSAAAAQRYATWIRQFAAGIASARTIVVLEADGLASLGWCPAAARPAVVGMIRDAVAVLAALPATSVYVDAGNSGWVPAAEMAARLRDVGVERARGIALNVANFNATATEIAYGKAVLAALRVPGTRLVIDTGRNGQGPAPAAAHCNPPGRGLGHAPTADTGDPAVDAFFWFKRPGESDDNGAGCSDAGPAPPSGDFWPDYALGLAQRSAM